MIDRLQKSFLGGLLLLLAGIILFIEIILQIYKFDPIDPRPVSGKFLYASILLLIFFAFPLTAFILGKISRTAQNLPLVRMRIALGVAWLVLFLLAVESLARIFPVYDSQPINPGVKYFWPDYAGPFNSLGYNDIEPSVLMKQDGKIRINYEANQVRVLVLGDSYTEGMGVRRRDIFTRLLENRLNSQRAEKKTIVFNAGVRGSNFAREMDILKKELPLIRPQIVIVCYTMDDAKETPGIARHEYKTVNGMIPVEYLLARKFMGPGGSYAYYHYFQKSKLQEKKYYVGSYADLYDDRYAGWLKVQALLAELSLLQKKSGFRAVLITLPVFNEAGKSLFPYETKVLRRAEKNGLEAYGFSERFLKFGKLSAFAVSSVDSHPNAKAHALIGKWLYEITRSGSVTAAGNRHARETLSSPSK